MSGRRISLPSGYATKAGKVVKNGSRKRSISQRIGEKKKALRQTKAWLEKSKGKSK